MHSPQLIVNPGTPHVFRVSLAQGVNSIGRDSTNVVCLQHESIREQHAEIHLYGEQAALLDLAGSSNTQPQALQPGARFRLGDIELELEMQFPPPLEAAGNPSTLQTPTAPATVSACCRHAVARAEWVCTSCGNKFCVACMKRPLRGTAPCPDCGGSCETLRSRVAPPKPASFAALVPNVLRYPFAGDGIYLVVGGAVFFSIAEFFAKAASLIGVLLELLIAGYLASYVKDIVRTSATGDDKPPDWPEFEDWIGDLLEPAVQLLAVYGLAFAPWILSRQLDASPLWTVSAGIWGCFSFPILWLALSMSDSLVSTLNPAPLLKAIFSSLPQYLITVCFFSVVVASSLAVEWLLGFAKAVPILPTLVSWFSTVYLLTIGMRLLGLYYRFNHHRFGW